MLEEWHRLERAAAASDRVADDRRQHAAAGLRVAPAERRRSARTSTPTGAAPISSSPTRRSTPTGRVTAVGNVRSALGPCAGLAGQDVDVRGPEWSYDGTKLVFAARPGAASGLDLWLLDVAAGRCRQLTSDAGRTVGTDVRVHNFDPVFAPDGSMVFASTRAGTLTLQDLPAERRPLPGRRRRSTSPTPSR